MPVSDSRVRVLTGRGRSRQRGEPDGSWVLPRIVQDLKDARLSVAEIAVRLVRADWLPLIVDHRHLDHPSIDRKVIALSYSFSLSFFSSTLAVTLLFKAIFRSCSVRRSMIVAQSRAFYSSGVAARALSVSPGTGGEMSFRFDVCFTSRAGGPIPAFALARVTCHRYTTR